LCYCNADKIYYLTKSFRLVNRKVPCLYEGSQRVEGSNEAIRLDRPRDSLYVEVYTGKSELKQVKA
jgi:hypothetical protein